ncbi:polysaccharide deacetylase family protein [Thalassospira sp. MA62]|nr:polysaccharide deacetylase family protein [Thalassospira sp. MA62]
MRWSMQSEPATKLRGVVIGVSVGVGLMMGSSAGFAQVSPVTTPSNPAGQEAMEPTEAQTATEAATDTPDIQDSLSSDADMSAQAEDEPTVSDQDSTASADEASVTLTGDATSAVIFMYHRFGEGDYPSTNITLDQFKAHIAELTSGPYQVLGVPQIVRALENGDGLPDRTVGITIDDAYRSVYETAWPIFRENNVPFTVFVSTEQIDAGYSNYMTWDMVRELARDGVTIGGHSQNHAHLPDLDIDGVKQELAHSAQRFEEELGFVPDLFAYPYGEANADVIAAVKDAGYKAAFGQQSGAMHTKSDFMYLPRFALNEHYGAMDRFKLAANSLPLLVSDITPPDYTLLRNPPAFGFTLDEPAPGMNCYPSEGNPTLSRLGEERVEIRLDGPVSSGRWRINCTAMGGDSRWHWFGMLYTVP